MPSLKFIDRTNEPEVQEEILLLLSNRDIWTNASIKSRLGKQLNLTEEDRARANKRPNEAKWEELVNNALSPSRRNSLPAKGLTKSPKRGHHVITPAGLEEAKSIIKKHRELEESLSAALGDIGLD